MKTNTTQTANYHPLGPLSLYFSPGDTKWPTAWCTSLKCFFFFKEEEGGGGKEAAAAAAAAAPCVQGTNPCRRNNTG